jgi:hypothetical protein
MFRKIRVWYRKLTKHCIRCNRNLTITFNMISKFERSGTHKDCYHCNTDKYKCHYCNEADNHAKNYGMGVAY